MILVHDLAAHTCLTKFELSSFAMLIVQLRTHEQFSECRTKSARFCLDHRCNAGTRTRSAIAPKGAPFSTVNAWNALRHWNAVRVEISLDRIVVKVPKFKQIADRTYVRCVFGSKSREWCGIEKDSSMYYFI